MSDDAHQEQNARTPTIFKPAPATAGAQALQKIGAIAAKAALSSIPLAVLAFDLGQAAVDFGNSRLAERLIDRLGDRVDGLEEAEKERLLKDEIYQLSAQASLRKMLMETTPKMADVIARAVFELGRSKRPNTERLELARAIDVLTEPSLHLLQMLYRKDPSRLTAREIEFAGGVIAHDSHFSKIVVHSMQMISWAGAVKDLERAGLINVVIDAGEYDIPPEMEVVVPPFDLFPLGECVLRLCFDDPNVPAFGAFAEDNKRG